MILGSESLNKKMRQATPVHCRIVGSPEVLRVKWTRTDTDERGQKVRGDVGCGYFFPFRARGSVLPALGASRGRAARASRAYGYSGAILRAARSSRSAPIRSPRSRRTLP